MSTICKNSNCYYPNDREEHMGYPAASLFANKKRRSSKKVLRSSKKVRSVKKIRRSGKKVRSTKKKL